MSNIATVDEPVETFDYWEGDTHIYVETMPNGDERISEYGKGWQRAYVRTKAQLDSWKAGNDD